MTFTTSPLFPNTERVTQIQPTTWVVTRADAADGFHINIVILVPNTDSYEGPHLRTKLVHKRKSPNGALKAHNSVVNFNRACMGLSEVS